ncbi:MAG: UDP-2,3-diacylglucosamine diphosphatase [Bacteroidales bacterium]
MEKNLYYFVSDVHLGLDYNNPQEREKKFSSFLLGLPSNTKALFLLGDIFDFWYEYKHVIPRNFTRTLGALAGLVDKGVEVYFFNGNHDIWTYGYFEKELGITVLQQPCVMNLEGVNFCLGHGDGLGKGDTGYKILNSIFKNKFLQFLFSGIHPYWAFSLGYAWSKHNRLARGCEAERKGAATQVCHIPFRGEDERIVKFANEFQNKSMQSGGTGKIDYFIFGHFHCPTRMQLKAGGEICILGEWIHTCDYLVFDGDQLSVCHV